MTIKCFRCKREIGEATWDAQSVEQHIKILELLKEGSICESCEYGLMKAIDKFKDGYY